MTKNTPKDKILTPINEILGVMPDRPSAEEVMRDLRQAGFPAEAIRLLREEEASEKIVGATGQNAGLGTRIFKFFEQMHTDGAVYLDQYREAGRQGKEVLAIKMESREQVDLAQQILSRHYAQNVRYFGTWEIKDLSLPRPEEAGRG